MFYPMNERGPGGPRYSRPGAVSYTHLDVYKRQQLNDGLADLYFRTGHTHDAEVTARGLLKATPNDIDAHKLLGKIYLRALSDGSNAVGSSSPSGNVLDQAIAEFEKIVALQPKSVEDRKMCIRDSRRDGRRGHSGCAAGRVAALATGDGGCAVPFGAAGSGHFAGQLRGFCFLSYAGVCAGLAALQRRLATGAGAHGQHHRGSGDLAVGHDLSVSRLRAGPGAGVSARQPWRRPTLSGPVGRRVAEQFDRPGDGPVWFGAPAGQRTAGGGAGA